MLTAVCAFHGDKVSEAGPLCTPDAVPTPRKGSVGVAVGADKGARGLSFV